MVKNNWKKDVDPFIKAATKIAFLDKKIKTLKQTKIKIDWVCGQFFFYNHNQHY